MNAAVWSWADYYEQQGLPLPGAADVDTETHSIAGYNLTPSEWTIYAKLRSGRLVSRRELVDALYGDREDGGPLCAERIVYIHLCRLNKRLSLLGKRVRNYSTIGWRIEPIHRHFPH